MQATDLDRRLQLLVYTKTGTDALGHDTFDWTPGQKAWANRNDVRDSERQAAGVKLSTRQVRFTVRSSSATRALTAKDRLLGEGATWDIDGVKPVGRGEWIEITATARAEG